MWRPLRGDAPSPVWPAGIAVRAFEPADAEAVHRLLDEAYRAWDGHYVPMAHDDWVRWMTGDVEFDPSCLVARRARRRAHRLRAALELRLAEGPRGPRARARPRARRGARARRVSSSSRGGAAPRRAQGRREQPDRRDPALRAARLRRRPEGGDLGAEPVSRAAKVSLLRWLRRQLRQPEPLRERLQAAICNDDPAEARRIVAHFEFSTAQSRHVSRLLDEWESELGLPAHHLDTPGGA